MKRLLANDTLTFTIRFFLGLIFIIASVEKIAQPDTFAAAIANYKLLPQVLVTAAATFLPWVELLCGLSLLFGILHRGSSLVAGSILIVFIAAVFIALTRDLDISCGCFSLDPSVGQIGWRKIGEDLLLLGLAVFSYFSDANEYTVETFILRGRADAQEPKS